MHRYEFIESYYSQKLNNSELTEAQDYISKLSDSDYELNEFDHYDSHEDKYYEKYRLCKIHYPKQDSILSRLAINQFYQTNRKYWKYDLSDDFEFQLIKYDIGGHYHWHCDYGLTLKKGIDRKLSITIQLTEPSEYDGGMLQLIDYSNRNILVPGHLGTVIVFDSKLPHKVLPVTRGKRISLVGWASGPRLK